MNGGRPFKVVWHPRGFVGLLFAVVAIFLVIPLLLQSFHGIALIDMKKDGLGAGYENQFDLLYYSFATMATLGMGDIVPVRHLAKTLTILEAMYGQLFVATVIAKLVSVWKK